MILIWLAFFVDSNFAQNAGIGTATPNTSAMVHLIWVDINQLAIGSCQFAKNTVLLAEMQEGFFLPGFINSIQLHWYSLPRNRRDTLVQ
ncbi:MAG: hypothetical protein ABIR78_01040 [Ferruginibacter sp.]